MLFLLQAPSVTVDVKTAQIVRTIPPQIYGTNESSWTGSEMSLSLGRQGGNRMTAYNWENNASNAGSDWYHQNDNFLGGGETPGEVPRKAVADAFAANKSMIVTVPLAGYVAADKNGGGDVANSGSNYLQTRFRPVVAKKKAAFAYPPSLTDKAVYVDEFVSWLESKFPNRTNGRAIWYSLDNEPDLWSSTHARIHPNAVTYAEMVQKTTDAAKAIKTVAPNAPILGFVSYGYNGYTSLQNAPDANGRDFIDFFLDSMRTAGASAGRRLVDYLDLHWYPEAYGNGQRITGNDVSAASVQARVQAPRSLWDPSYTEDSWIAQWATQGPIRLIPRVKNQIAAHYPGTNLAITEYNYGASNHISGAVAHADALGVFGREGVGAACFWPLQSDNRFVHAAFDAFRNFDGKGGKFGDQSLPATSSDVASVTAYASRSSEGRVGTFMVLVNKTTAVKVVRVNLDATATSLLTYTLQGTNPKMAASNLGSVSGKAATLTLPALSVTSAVLK